jgi:hypothetical protein
MHLFVEWSVKKFGEATNFESISAEQLNSKLGKVYAEAVPQPSKRRITENQQYHKLNTETYKIWEGTSILYEGGNSKVATTYSMGN